jgi:hypothetical protein
MTDKKEKPRRETAFRYVTPGGKMIVSDDKILGFAVQCVTIARVPKVIINPREDPYSISASSSGSTHTAVCAIRLL